MYKSTQNPWLERVEAIEEQLEQVKLSWYPTRHESSRTFDIVQKTAGLLSRKFPSGTAYERRIRLAWEHASQKRIA